MRWDNIDTDGKPWTYPRGELLAGKISLGSYAQWLPSSIAREGLDPKTPIHAWLNQASFIDGKYNKQVDGWFADEASAKAFVEAEAAKMLAEAGLQSTETRSTKEN